MASTTWADQPFRMVPDPRKSPANQNVTHYSLQAAYEMAMAHNGILRGLNSIYIQAPYVSASTDVQDLMQYILLWHDWVHHHHEAEEEGLFPGIERLAKEQGVTAETGVGHGFMDENIAQHARFQDGLHEINEYAKAVRGGKEQYDAQKLRGIIDGFGHIVSEHLTDEIETLLKLRVLEEGSLKSVFTKFDESLRAQDKDALYPMVMGTSDKTFAGGNDFPAVPFFVPWLIHYQFERKYKGAWRFNPCSTWSKPRPLQFIK